VRRKAKRALRPSRGKSRAKRRSRKEIGFLRVARGCINNCSYCGIKHAVGPIRSKPLRECAAEYARLLAEGYRSIQILAEDLGLYGVDTGVSLPQLLERLAGIDGDSGTEWHVDCIHPAKLARDGPALLQIAKEGRIALLTTTLQSGSPRLLRAMNRSYDADEVIDTLRKLREANPKLVVKTHFIVGFPTERDEDHERTIEVATSGVFDFAHIFSYVDREGTAASKIRTRPAEETVRARIESLREALEREGVECKTNHSDHLKPDD
jgi:tRNA A37 methylthiotransferase MiaB